MHIGMIGGIGPAATDYYYRRLIEAFADDPDALDVTIAHANSPTLLTNLAKDDRAAQSAIFQRLSQRLAAAGAEAVAVTAIAGHFCIAELKAVSPLPVIDLLESVARRVQQAGYKAVGILGTKTVMQTGMYGCLPDVKILPPPGASLDAVHDAYVAMAAAGRVTDAQRQLFFECGRGLCETAGAEAVLLGGTDLVLAFDGRDCGFEAIDCAGLHLDDLIAAAKR